MKNSDIFEAYAKIMEQKAHKPEHTEKDAKRDFRVDSISIDEINKLYGIKPIVPKDMEYKHNVYETAHKEPVIISPSHDKLNGLIESENERQAIMLRIVRKNPDGQLDQRKLAQKNLMLSLVSLANHLDATNSSELCKLADVCLEQVAQPNAKQLTKLALVPVMVGAAAALLGALYAKQHLAFHSDGWQQDYQKAMNEINDLTSSNANFGVGYEYSPQFLQTVSKLSSILSSFNSKVQEVLPILEKIDEPHTASELIELAKQPAAKDASNAVTSFKGAVIQVDTFLKKIVADFSNPTYKQRAIVQKGFLSSLVDSAEILHGGKGLIADDLDDVAHSLETLSKDIKGILDSLNKAEHIQESFLNEMSESQKELAPHMEAGTEEAATSPTAPAKGISSDDDESSQLEKLMNAIQEK